MIDHHLIKFVEESNRIEGITRAPTSGELLEFERFLDLPKITVEELERFVSVYQPGAVLRERQGLDVRVGRHFPPLGGPLIRKYLEGLLDCLERDSGPAYFTHIRYEDLHPFTDGNGRSGRALWAWQMKQFPLGFLHHFYYQTLDHQQ